MGSIPIGSNIRSKAGQVLPIKVASVKFQVKYNYLTALLTKNNEMCDLIGIELGQHLSIWLSFKERQ